MEEADTEVVTARSRFYGLFNVSEYLRSCSASSKGFHVWEAFLYFAENSS